jgi:hypothetical protein
MDFFITRLELEAGVEYAAVSVLYISRLNLGRWKIWPPGPLGHLNANTDASERNLFMITLLCMLFLLRVSVST